VVQSGSGRTGPGSANNANALAVTYSALISTDSTIVNSAARSLGVSPSTLSRRISVSVETGTAVMLLKYSAPTEAAAVRGAQTVAHAVGGTAGAALSGAASLLRGEMAGLSESLRQAGPPGEAGGMLSEEGIKNLISQVSLTFPEEDLEKGKSWSSRSRFPIPKVGTLVMDRTFTYQGPDPKAADLRQVSLKSSVKLEPTGNSNEAVKITSHDGKGEFTFDPQAGRILSTRVNDLLRMTLSVQGQDLEQTTETVTTMTLARDGQPK
jgi:hypothetical protein